MEVDEVKEIKSRRPLKYWFFKGIVVRPIAAIIVIAVLVTILFVAPDAKVSAKPLKQLTQEDLLSPLLQPIKYIIFWNSNDQISYLKSSNGSVAIVSYNITSDTELILLTDDQLSQTLGRRVSPSNFSISPNGVYILVQVDITTRYDGLVLGNYLIYSLVNNTYSWLGNSQGSPIISNVQWNPSGNMIAYVSLDDLWLYDMDNMQYTRLTNNGLLPEMTNGRQCWIYQKEIFVDFNAIWWSPDGLNVAFFVNNESLVDIVSISISTGEAFPTPFDVRYPWVGTPIPVVSIYVHNLPQNTTTILTSTVSSYITAVSWTSYTELMYRTMSRNQTMEYYSFWNSSTNTTQTFLSQKETSGWVQMKDPLYLGNSQLAFIRNNSGNYHINVMDITSGIVSRVLTSGPYDVTDIVGYNSGLDMLYYLSTQDSPLDRHLYSLNASATQPQSGTNMIPPNQPGYYSASFNKPGTTFILSYEGPDIPNQQIYKTGNTNEELPVQVKTIQDNSIFRATLNGYYFATTKNFTVAGSVPGRSLAVQVLIPPKDSVVSTTYGLLIHADGTPNQQSVTNRWQFGFDEFIASTMGVVVARVDPTGTAGRGSSFMFGTYLHLGTVSSQDYATAAKNIGSISNFPVKIDNSRIGIWGTGVGGYNALRPLTFKSTNPFKSAISVDPIIDWALYEAVFSERFMLLPSQNVAGYNETRLSNYISNFAKSNFLLIYGTESNEVYGVNSLEFKKLLTQARIAFQTMSYTEWLDDDKIHFYKVMEAFVRSTLL